MSAPGGSAPGGSTPGGICSGGFASDMPPVNRITDMSKNITLASTSLRPVKIQFRLTMLLKLVYDIC